MRLNGKLAIVTAAASGMGRAGVERFVREGARVAAIDISREALDDLIAHFGADRVSTIVADLSRSEEHTSELQSLMRISYSVFCLNTKNRRKHSQKHKNKNTTQYRC